MEQEKRKSIAISTNSKYISENAIITNIKISIIIDNRFRIWVNGHELSSGWTSDLTIDYNVPAAYFIPGQNFIAVHASDRGGLSVFDMKMDADCTCKQQMERMIF